MTAMFSDESVFSFTIEDWLYSCFREVVGDKSLKGLLLKPFSSGGRKSLECN
jgi:hypothetical protein